ncbi:MAG: hypothetical protein AAB074_02185 [Planctomycetota bacterium]
MKPTRKGKTMKDTLVAFRLPEALRRALEEAAEKDRRTVSDYLRLLIEDTLKSPDTKGKGR